jgi:hypothetical protein
MWGNVGDIPATKDRDHVARDFFPGDRATIHSWRRLGRTPHALRRAGRRPPRQWPGGTLVAREIRFHAGNRAGSEDKSMNKGATE